MNLPVVIVVCGVSGAGKTTVGSLLATRLGRTFFDADDYHSPASVEKMRRGQPLTDDDRTPWLDALSALIARRVQEGRPAVLACSALKAAYRDRLGIDQRQVMTVFLRGPKDLIAARVAARAHQFMPGTLIDSQFETLEPPAEGICVDVDAPPEVIVERIVTALGRL